MNKDALARALAPLLRRIRLSVARGIVSLINDASPGHQTVQVVQREGEPADDLERLQEYGFFSVPLAGAEALTVAVSGKQDHLVVACLADHRYRPRGGQEGDAGIYHHEGHEIRLEKNGVARVTSKKLIFDIEDQTEINSPKTIINGDVDIAGGANISGPVTMPSGATISGIDFDDHKHKVGDTISEGPQ